MREPPEPKDFVSHKWTLEVLRALEDGPRRYRDLAAECQRTGRAYHPATLVATLDYLRRYDLIVHIPGDDDAAAVYRVTDLGRGLREVLERLERLIDEYRARH
jgi:DNA-binding HxlR family transcriptional regulator